jgi:hypothetical protein
MGKCPSMKHPVFLFSALLLVLPISGCDQISSSLGIESASRKAARLGEEGKAVGGACRQSGRAIEDCYSIYAWLPMEAIYTGWREMDVYMRENNLTTITPLLPPVQDPNRKKPRKKATETEEAETENPEEKAASGNESVETPPAGGNATPEAAPEAPAPVQGNAAPATPVQTPVAQPRNLAAPAAVPPAASGALPATPPAAPGTPQRLP